jgi:cyclic beta-1,2-glucan synthetase
MTVTAIVEKPDGKLAKRLSALTRDMDFTKLYDASRTSSTSLRRRARHPVLRHYDLLASESRILSFVAIALGQVPLKHWSKLGRGMARAGGARRWCPGAARYSNT